MTAWKSHEDVEKDLWLFSEISNHERDTDEQTQTPPSILQWNARIGANRTASIFDADLPSENITYVFSGRGRGGVSKIFKPGLPVDHSPKEEDDIRRRIREVSGLGYSNELIEKHLKKTSYTPTIQDEKEFCDADVTEDFQLARNSPTVLPSNSKSPRSGTPNIRLESSPTMKEKAENQNHPPPLSIILSQGKKHISNITDEKKIKSSLTSRQNSPRLEHNSKLRADATEFRIHSSLRADAPEFKLSPRISSDSSEGSVSKSPNRRTGKCSNGHSDISYGSTSGKEHRPMNFSKRYEVASPMREQKGEELNYDTDRKSFTSSDDECLFRGGYSWRNPTSDNDNDNNYNRNCPYRQAASANRRDFTRRDNRFDIKSENDFPTLFKNSNG